MYTEERDAHYSTVCSESKHDRCKYPDCWCLCHEPEYSVTIGQPWVRPANTAAHLAYPSAQADHAAAQLSKRLAFIRGARWMYFAISKGEVVQK